ncbi:MAG: DinB family protein [Gammaproteobacteria bacterium]
MNAIDYARAMASYNRWMNKRIYDACSRLPDEERKRDVGAFLESIHGTLNHLLLADRIWIGRFTGRPFGFKSLDQELYSEFSQLRAQRKKDDNSIIAWAGSLTGKDLSRELSYTSVVNPQPRKYPFWFAITNFFNHQTHHVGQVTTLLRQRGIDPGVTDLIWLPEFQTSHH